MSRFPALQNASFTVHIADNQALGIHRSGYNGLAALIPRHSGNNLFVPTYAGLNYETIGLKGMPVYLAPGRDDHQAKFEPRGEAMHIEEADAESAVLVQPPTRHAGVSARIEFRVEEPHYLYQTIELTFHKKFCGDDEASTFSSLWASYLHMPADRHLYLKPSWRWGSERDGWLGLTKEGHGSQGYVIRALPGDRQLSAEDHLLAMDSQAPLAEDEATGGPGSPISGGPLDFYYGLCWDQVFLMMFRQPEQVSLAYSPNGGGTEPEWCPAWDYVLRLDDAPVGSTHTWEICLVVKPYAGRADVLDELRRFQEG